MAGLLTFLDPPRPDTKRTIERALVRLGAGHGNDVCADAGCCHVLAGKEEGTLARAGATTTTPSWHVFFLRPIDHLRPHAPSPLPPQEYGVDVKMITGDHLLIAKVGGHVLCDLDTVCAPGSSTGYACNPWLQRPAAPPSSSPSPGGP